VFGAPDSGFTRLMRDLTLAEPTLVLVHYGENEAYAGDAGLAAFRQGLERLLAEIAQATAARIVLLGPRQHENLGPPLPDPSGYNAQLGRYNAAMREVAEDHALPFVDLNTVLPVDPAQPLTSNGLHLTPEGSRKMANRLAARLLAPVDPPYDVLDTPRGRALQQAIAEKNELFFHRHRPQNETYLFLFRKHEQGNNAAEVFQFDPLIESKEQEIARLRQP
ncbi:MAG: hypothetical protein KDA41_16570, partial [Planctomycetales bacterium]|nr:hypothetical protein [Planctomycetales bacterium]